MAQHDELYQRAVYYHIALQRDVGREADFIQAVYERHTGNVLSAVLDVACGPGYHARALASRGVRAVGLDYSAAMLDLAREQAEAEGVAVDWRVADMRDFHLEVPVDMAVCMFDGVDALLTNDDFVRHLRSVAAHLGPGGLYLIDCTHPRDCSYRHYGDYRYEGRQNGTRVEIAWATNDPHIDPVTGVAEVELEMRVDDGREPLVIHDTALERCFTAPEIRLLAQLSGVLEVIAWYGDADLDQPLDRSERSQRMIAVLKKTVPERSHGR